ncbi:two component transcriptional regulator, winged helix family [Sulfurimonas denitrificans DSM 1251]|uniref:Two component transcriptional regulator, winged helix family n=1 Tax=Sulfurimonas denitrificans (strain ATCC 33889 / DSM 1251) TaxID=326298 RepID=Q30QT9_SULDN|nr:response regulator transcription factor [Sulfurimonas denitrificans]ABB44642.1 two component transcriptional regulator, winged helix family [Sulfurimonas denitrificans DSM 1251]
MKILYLEDDITLCDTIAEYLIEEGFDVKAVYDGEEALEQVYKESFDLFLFDVNVPKINGFKLLHELRGANILTPTIFTTSLQGINDLSMGYESGADDYIKKPFALKELLFRIKALLKREFKSQNFIIKIEDGVKFNTFTNELYIRERKTALNPKETLLLKLLLKHQNECVLLEDIYSELWTHDEPYSDMSLRTYIKNLRKLIGKEMIISIKKVGYKLVQ